TCNVSSTKWSEKATDSGNSRNWAGIHFVDANRHGVEVGRKVGRNALDKASSTGTSARTSTAPPTCDVR
ncbi:MAG TPA: hypothetical protein VJ140_09850, partial [Actinomycetota bacterium]|nr:hypothetical protein [Actinomycetota bacterium]